MKVVLIALCLLTACTAPNVLEVDRGKQEWIPGTAYQTSFGVLVVEDSARGVACYIKYNQHDDTISCVKIR